MIPRKIRLAISGAALLALTACGNSDGLLGKTGAGNADGKADLACVQAAKNYNQIAGDGASKSTAGAFSEPFCEERFFSDRPDDEIPDRGDASGGQTNPMPFEYQNLEHCARRSENKFYECKPSAGSIALLPDNRLIYFNALESTENAEFNVVQEGGGITVNDQTRVLALLANGTATWSRPVNNDSGAVNPTIQPGAGTIVPVLGNVDPTTTPDDPEDNDGALFCSHLVNLYDGRVLAAGGTDYYTELGIVELEGIKNTRIFDPTNDTWTQADPMSWGRWYPTMVTLANGNIFVASGVRKLIKPVYGDRPQDSGRNETHTEIFQPGCNDGKGKWTDNGARGQKSLPLYPRLHLLPNNTVLYTAAGQAYNPQGQSYDEALWNFASVYDPAANTWSDLGVPGLGTPYAGFRGSTTSVMLPLTPTATGRYDRAHFLTMGGVIGTTPGSYIAFAHSRVSTVDLTAGGSGSFATRSVGALNQPRWFGQAVLLPTGQVMLFSGSDVDEVVGPGSETPVLEPELYDPATETWSVMATQGRPRTYHNSAVLLPDGRVLVGGHSIIPTFYALHMDVPMRGPGGRDATFEIFSPPYVFAPRPVITSAPAQAAPGDTLTVVTPNAAAVVNGGHAVLVRRTALTHLVDGDQRNVVLPIVRSDGESLTLRVPSNDAAQNQAVLPPGHYLLFIVVKDGDRLVPSESAPVLITGADLSCR